MVRAILGLLPGLYRQAKRHVRGAIECLEQMIAGQAPKLSGISGFRFQFDTPIAGLALGAGNV
jgi:hypothetical protein